MRELLKIKNSEISSKNQLFTILIYAVLLIIYYGNSIQNDYSLDDDFIYTTNEKAIHGLDNVSEIFTSNSFDYGAFQYGYRPIAVLSFALENELFGINPKASHAINLLIYLLSVFLLFKIVASLFPEQDFKLSFLTGFLFLILPIHSEIANNVKCRDELLMLVFGLLSVFYWLKGSKKPIYFVLSILALVLAILSKKSAFIFLGAIPLISYYQVEGDWKKSLKTFLIMILPVFLFKLITKFIKNGKSDRIYSFIENPLFDPNFNGSKLTMITESTWFYLKKMLFPFELVSYYGYDTIPIEGFHITSIIAVVLIIGLAIIAFKGLRKKEIYALGILILLGGLFPFVNLIMPMVGIVAERFFTLSSIGLCIAVVFGANYLIVRSQNKKWKNYALIALVVYSLIYLMAIRDRNADWKSLNTLAKADYYKEPKSVNLNKILAYINFIEAAKTRNANERSEKGRKSLELYNYVLKTYPSKEVHNEKGTLLYKLYKKYPEAEKEYLKALQLDPEFLVVMKNLGIMYSELKETDKAIYYYKELLKKDSEQIDVYIRLVRIFSEANRYIEAIDWINNGLSKNVNNYDLILNKGHIYLSMSNMQEALNWYIKANELKPSNELRQRIIQIQNQLKKAV